MKVMNLPKFKCHKCQYKFNVPHRVDYGVELWEYVECCPSCMSERIEEVKHAEV
jgi:predicted Zn-ribbon and HTH transcriptional regulator